MSSWFTRLTGYTLQDPWLLLLWLAVPALLVLRARRAPAALFGPARFLEPEPGEPTPPLSRLGIRALTRRLPGALSAIGLLLAAIALARPVERTPLPLRARGLDILLCLDLSSSMQDHDLDPARTRMQVAKAAAAEFVRARPDDRIGLVTFARYPDLRCPPTQDHGALLRFLDGTEMVASDSPEDATGIGASLARGAEVLARSVAKTRVLVLLTDGEENVATAQTPDEIAPRHAAQFCAQHGVRVYTIAAGLGSRERDGTRRPLDTKELQAVADLTGGAFFAARDAAALGSIYARIGAIERTEFDAPRYRTEERFAPFLLLGLLLLLLGRGLRAVGVEALP